MHSSFLRGLLFSGGKQTRMSVSQGLLLDQGWRRPARAAIAPFAAYCSRSTRRAIDCCRGEGLVPNADFEQQAPSNSWPYGHHGSDVIDHCSSDRANLALERRSGILPERKASYCTASRYILRRHVSDLPEPLRLCRSRGFGGSGFWQRSLTPFVSVS